jgi:hypothetical protein
MNGIRITYNIFDLNMFINEVCCFVISIKIKNKNKDVDLTKLIWI